jgi:hypothetical protein
MAATVFLSGSAIALAWKLYQLSKDPRNAPLRSERAAVGHAASAWRWLIKCT